jgi:hypothetical protein
MQYPNEILVSDLGILHGYRYNYKLNKNKKALYICILTFILGTSLYPILDFPTVLLLITLTSTFYICMHVANKQVIFFWLSLYILISVEQEAGKQMQALSVKHQAQLIGKGGPRTLLFKVRNY